MALFTPAASASPRDPAHLLRSARASHLARTNDILHLSLQRGDLARAKSAWAILIRCKEFDWRKDWRVGLAVLGRREEDRVAFLQKAFLAVPEEKEAILRELTLSYIAQHRERAALDQLELYLHQFPFQDNPTLHAHAGMLCLFLAQGTSSTSSSGSSSNLPDHALLRQARQSFLTALSLDPENDAARAYRDLVDELAKDRPGEEESFEQEASDVGSESESAG
ncbi:hypothetical protein CALCODRAFT_495507 [Calocera cornea HHB12733]|uniref:ER membrane protein complex subunit 2 n=1 Tax=Calocera cornea HHB12733 TaxID=1353952 RepID=A0A165GGA2_9BASI|nr:hypothetical protein CALCODRAFT_495507 [Calocera cornea HHB12733]